MLQKALREHECGIKFSIREERSTMRKSEVRNATGKLFCKHFIRDGDRMAYTKNLPSEDLHADFLSEIKAQKRLDTLLSDDRYTLSNCLKELMIRAGWKDANIFWDHTLVHRNYFFRINSNKLGKVRKNTLMAICVGLGLTVLTVQRVFKKAELFLSESSMPDRLYMSIIEKSPGIIIDKFNQILIRAGQAPLGTREREHEHKREKLNFAP